VCNLGPTGNRLHRGSRCVRGTDRASSEDWTSNLHWLVRLLPLYDQYEHGTGYRQSSSRGLLGSPASPREQRRSLRWTFSRGRFSAQAAYVNPRIRQVYAFDPSIVTGSTDTNVRQHTGRIRPGIEHRTGILLGVLKQRRLCTFLRNALPKRTLLIDTSSACAQDHGDPGAEGDAMSTKVAAGRARPKRTCQNEECGTRFSISIATPSHVRFCNTTSLSLRLRRLIWPSPRTYQRP